MSQAREVVAGISDGHVEGLQRQDVRLPRRGNVEADDPTREDVGDEGDVSEPGPCGDLVLQSSLVLSSVFGPCESAHYSRKSAYFRGLAVTG